MEEEEGKVEYGVYKVFSDMRVTRENAELASYQSREVSQVWFTNICSSFHQTEFRSCIPQLSIFPSKLKW